MIIDSLVRNTGRAQQQSLFLGLQLEVALVLGV